MVAAGLGIAASASAQMASPMSPSMPMSGEAHTTAMKHADMQYKVAKEACASMSGNAKDVCMAGAKGNESIAKADADAALANTPKAREQARVAHAQAAYDVSVEKCDDLAGNRKDVCVKEANAALVKGKADANVDRVAADSSKEAATKQADARKEATVDKRDADYNVAIEKCDSLAGAAKDACVGTAKVQYGKS
jgi:hypothetical protein